MPGVIASKGARQVMNFLVYYVGIWFVLVRVSISHSAGVGVPCVPGSSCLLGPKPGIGKG